MVAEFVDDYIHMHRSQFREKWKSRAHSLRISDIVDEVSGQGKSIVDSEESVRSILLLKLAEGSFRIGIRDGKGFSFYADISSYRQAVELLIGLVMFDILGIRTPEITAVCERFMALDKARP